MTFKDEIKMMELARELVSFLKEHLSERDVVIIQGDNFTVYEFNSWTYCGKAINKENDPTEYEQLQAKIKSLATPSV